MSFEKAKRNGVFVGFLGTPEIEHVGFFIKKVGAPPERAGEAPTLAGRGELEEHSGQFGTVNVK